MTNGAFQSHPADEAGLDAVLAVKPVWRSLPRAAEAVGLPQNILLHAGPPFADNSAATKPIRNSACVAAVFEGLADTLDAAGEAVQQGRIILRPAQDFGVVTPLAAVVSASMRLHEVFDAGRNAPPAFAPVNGGNGPAMRLGLCNDDVVRHMRWLNGAFAECLERAHEAAAGADGVDLTALAKHGLENGDDCHGRTVAATAELTRLLAPVIDADAEARAFLDNSPSFFLNLWMAACKCMLSAADGTPGCSLITGAGGNGAETGVIAAAKPGHWFTAPAAAPKGDTGAMPARRALGAIGDSAIVDAAGFGAMAMSYAPAQREALSPFMPADGFELPALLLAREHPGFGALQVRTGLSARRAAAAGRGPVVSLGILDAEGEAGRLGGGIFETPLALFEAAARAADA